jgi:hypothetical protein
MDRVGRLPLMRASSALALVTAAAIVGIALKHGRSPITAEKMRVWAWLQLGMLSLLSVRSDSGVCPSLPVPA